MPVTCIFDCETVIIPFLWVAGIKILIIERLVLRQPPPLNLIYKQRAALRERGIRHMVVKTDRLATLTPLLILMKNRLKMDMQSIILTVLYFVAVHLYLSGNSTVN